MPSKPAQRSYTHRPDSRSVEAKAYRKLYWTNRWKQVRADQLRRQPLCENCLKHGRVTAATVCDHIDPESKRTAETFFVGPFQSLCDAEPYRCHSSAKQSEERLGYVKGNTIDGRPVAADHPWNRE